MPVSSRWRPQVALFFLAAAVSLTLGCGGSNDPASQGAGTLEVSGKVTYLRIPLLKGADGRPLGLETDPAKFKTLPARGVRVRAVKFTEETRPDGTKVKVWTDASNYAYTSAEGSYSLTVPKDTPVFMQVDCVFNGGATIRLVGDPDGVESQVPITDRPFYSLRKGLDGSSPAGEPTPTTRATGNVTVDFHADLETRWWLGPLTTAGAPQAQLEPVPSGSRPLAIGDTVYAFSSTYGSPSTPNILNLHYRPGLSHPRGSFVEYDRQRYPLAFDGNALTYFGSVRGGHDNEDAFDEGVLLPLLARNHMFSGGKVALLPVGAPQALPDLSPDVALLEGLPDTMAAILLKSPYLADTHGTQVDVRDIRDLSTLPEGGRTVFNPANLGALAWDLALKAQSLPLPGVPTDWDRLDPAAFKRFFALIQPVNADSVVIDIPNVFAQVGRLKEDKEGSETVDLKTVFTDAVLTPLLEPFGIPWPRPSAGALAAFQMDWGADPNTLASPLPAVPFTMAQARPVHGTLPNLSSGEVLQARFKLTKDTAYNIRILPSPAPLPPGAHLQLILGSTVLSFRGEENAAVRLVLGGDSSKPVYYYPVLRLMSPTAVVPEFSATVRLDAVP